MRPLANIGVRKGSQCLISGRFSTLSTFTINLIAGFLAGLVAALALGGTLDEPWRLVLATGFLGGFSTFSTAINEMVTLFRKHRYPTAAAYLVLSLGVPVVAAACGFLV